MMWLWAIGPLVVLCTASGLVVASRSLDRIRAEVVDERQRMRSDAVPVLRTSLIGLGQDIDSFHGVPAADTAATAADR